jgi:UDP-N-acetylmuramoyl-L-alanyl-D-glutamate--2,6-diaminopimelate ligase
MERQANGRPDKEREKSLSDLTKAMGDLVERRAAKDVRVSGLAYDSRAVKPGDMFFAVPGTVADGHAFVGDAVKAGASAVCVQRDADVAVPSVIVTDVRRALARAAAEFYDNPAASLRLLGVTGTNGKTTTVFLLESILRAAGMTTGLIGTIETHVAGAVRPGVRTTPDSLDLQKLFAELREAGVEGVAMEVTSHALALHRVEGLHFDACAFTNLSQDHLDFHPDMEDYFLAKRSLFTPEMLERGAVNVDDEWGRRLLDSTDVPCLGFGTSEEAEVRGEVLRSGPSGNDILITAPGPVEMKISTPLVGHFNVSNSLAACATALQAGIDPAAIERGLAQVSSVPGRFESVDAGQPFTVVVDYAHTPDSLDNVLEGARTLARDGRVICLFGCGGDRDRGKRPLMGAVVARLADYVIVTSDNPRSEDPIAIIDAIVEGLIAERRDGPDRVLPDRREAIISGIDEARPGDVVVIAGKGHETGQEFADKIVPFDDRKVAREALAAAGYAGGDEA